jgi:hypothetical protein
MQLVPLRGGVREGADGARGARERRRRARGGALHVESS